MKHTKSQSFLASLPSKIGHSKILEAKPVPLIPAIILLIIFNLQITFTLFEGTYLRESKTEIQFDKLVQTLLNFLLGKTVVIIDNLSILGIIILTAISIYLLSISIQIIMLSINLKSNAQAPAFLRNFWYWIIYTHYFLISFPIHVILTNMSATIISSSALLSQGEYIAVLAVGVVGIIINQLVSLVPHISLLIFKTSDPFSRFTNNYFIYDSFYRVIITFVYRASDLISGVRYFQWIADLINLVYFASRIINMIKVAPFYKNKLSKISNGFTVVFLIIACWNFIDLILSIYSSPISKGIFASFLFMACPLAIKTYQMIVDSQRSLILNLDSIGKKDQFRSMLSLKNFLKIMTPPKLDDGNKKFTQRSIEMLGLKSSKIQVDIKDNHEISNYLFKLANSNTTATKISLVIANILFENFHYYSKSYFICSKILTRTNISYTEKLTCNFIIRNIQKALMLDQHDNADLASFMESINSHETLVKFITNQIDAKERFYKLLDHENPDLLEVSENSLKIQLIQNDIDKLWNNLNRKSLDNYPPLLKIFAYFKIFVDLQMEVGKDLIKKYNKVMISKHLNEQGKGKNLYSVNSVFVVVNADGQNMGKILSCTTNIKKLFGHESQDLVGKNIGVLMPNFIAVNHDNMMRKTLDDSIKMLKMSSKETYGKHKDGQIVPIIYKSTIYPKIDEGLSFWGMIKPVSLSSNEILLVDEKGSIEGMTKHLSESLTISITEKVTWNNFMEICVADHIGGSQVFMTHIQETSVFPGNAQELDKFLLSNENENPLDEYVRNNTELIITLRKGSIKKDNPRKFRGKIELRNYNGKKMYAFYMQKMNIKFQNSKTDLSGDSEDFGMVNEYTDKELFMKNGESKNLYTENIESTKLVKSQTKKFAAHDEKTVTDVSDDGGDDDDDPKFSEIEEKDMDDRASVMSVSNAKLEEEFAKTLDDIRKGLNYYKFREAHIPFILLILFFLSFIALIFIMFFNATFASEEVQNRLQAISLTSKVGQDMSAALVFLFPIYLYDKVYQLPFNTTALFFVREVYPYYTDMIARNSELKNYISKLSQAEKDYFFNEDIRMYTDNFYSIPDTNTYQKVNFFTMVNSIFSSASYYIKNYMQTKSQPRNYALDFLFGNVLNDLWIKNINAPEVMEKAMEDSLNNIKITSDAIYAVVLVFLGLLVISLIIVFLKSNFETIAFLRLIINNGASLEVQISIDNLLFFRAFLTKSVRNSDYENKKFAKAKKGKGEKYVHKSGRTQKIFIKTLFRLLVSLVFLSAPFILTWKAHSTFLDASERIMPVIRDINKLNNISYTTIPVQGYLGLSYIRPRTKVLNTNISLVLDQAIEDGRMSVSWGNDYLPESQTFLSENICPYYKVNQLYPNCTNMFRQLGIKGITSSVLAMSDFRIQFKYLVSRIPLTPLNIGYLSTLPDFVQSGFLLVYGISNAITIFQTQLVDNLISKLKQASSDTIVLFAPGIVFGVGISVFIGYIIYYVIWKERKLNSKTLTVLPIHIIMNSRGIKQYLLKESKRFHLLLKKYDKLKQKEDNILSKFKNR